MGKGKSVDISKVSPRKAMAMGKTPSSYKPGGGKKK
jgi:hypothetical protein